MKRDILSKKRADPHWVVIFAAELVDLELGDRINQLLVTSLEQFDNDFLIQAVVLAAQGRLHHSVGELFEAAERFEQAGMPSASSRCFADITRLEPGPTRFKAIQGIIRAQMAWDGAPMPWLTDIDNLPTPRQLEVALTTLNVQTAGTAEALHISKRTVENHLYRVYNMLGVNGLDELRNALSTPRA